MKRQGCDADHSSPSSTEVKNERSYTLHFPYTLSWRGKEQLDLVPFDFSGKVKEAGDMQLLPDISLWLSNENSLYFKFKR